MKPMKFYQIQKKGKNMIPLVQMQTFPGDKILIQAILVLTLETSVMALTHIQVLIRQVFQTFLIPYVVALSKEVGHLLEGLLILEDFLVALIKRASQNLILRLKYQLMKP